MPRLACLLAVLLAVLLAAPAFAGPSASQIKRVLKKGDADEVRALLGELGDMDGKQLKAVLGATSRVPQLGLYDDLVALLARTQGESFDALRVASAKQKNPVIRFLILDALAAHEDPRAQETLVTVATDDKSMAVAVYAVRRLKRRGTLTAVDALIGVLADTEDSKRSQVAREARSALSDLTGQDLVTSDAWRSWWREHKRGFAAPAEDEGDGGTRTVLDRMRTTRPGSLRTLERLGPDDLIAIEGDYDEVQEVLTTLELPHRTVAATDFDALELDPTRQLLIVNCHSAPFSAAGVAKVREFVARGGYLFTSDWALRNLLKRAFPEAITMAGETAAEITTRIAPPGGVSINPLLRDVFPLNPWRSGAGEGKAMTWQVDAISDIVGATPALEVLVEAPDLPRCKIVACTFGFTTGKGGRPVTGAAPEEVQLRSGRVLHVLSHFSHQKDESGDGYALQQLLLNFVLEKQEARRAAAARQD
jgi:hypothetical protein